MYIRRKAFRTLDKFLFPFFCYRSSILRMTYFWGLKLKRNEYIFKTICGQDEVD